MSNQAEQTSDSTMANDMLDTLNQVYQYVKSIYGDTITSTNIITITSLLIQIVEKYKSLTGNQKKMIVANTLKKLVNDSKINDDEKKILNLIIENTLPAVIDGFIDAINGNVKFNKVKAKSILKKLCCCSS
jgi:hypothetical protein